MEMFDVSYSAPGLSTSAVHPSSNASYNSWNASTDDHAVYNTQMFMESCQSATRTGMNTFPETMAQSETWTDRSAFDHRMFPTPSPSTMDVNSVGGDKSTSPTTEVKSEIVDGFPPDFVEAVLELPIDDVKPTATSYENTVQQGAVLSPVLYNDRTERQKIYYGFVKQIAHIICSLMRDIHLIREWEQYKDIRETRAKYVRDLASMRSKVSVVHSEIQRYFSPVEFSILLYKELVSLPGIVPEQVTERIIDFMYYIILEGDRDFTTYFRDRVAGSSQHISPYEGLYNEITTLPQEIKCFFTIEVPLERAQQSSNQLMSPPAEPRQFSPSVTEQKKQKQPSARAKKPRAPRANAKKNAQPVMVGPAAEASSGLGAMATQKKRGRPKKTQQKEASFSEAPPATQAPHQYSNNVQTAPTNYNNMVNGNHYVSPSPSYPHSVVPSSSSRFQEPQRYQPYPYMHQNNTYNTHTYQQQNWTARGYPQYANASNEHYPPRTLPCYNRSYVPTQNSTTVQCYNNQPYVNGQGSYPHNNATSMTHARPPFQPNYYATSPAVMSLEQMRWNQGRQTLPPYETIRSPTHNEHLSGGRFSITELAPSPDGNVHNSWSSEPANALNTQPEQVNHYENRTVQDDSVPYQPYTSDVSPQMSAESEDLVSQASPTPVAPLLPPDSAELYRALHIIEGGAAASDSSILPSQMSSSYADQEDAKSSSTEELLQRQRTRLRVLSASELGLAAHREKVAVDIACMNCGNAAKISCQNCARAQYCSRECQITHWNANHKENCSRMMENDAGANN